jgi:phosphoenolpyruvate-protein kinase (PTS system EI component)
MIQEVVRAAKKTGIGVALCGEMAGDPLCTFILMAIGIQELSLNAGNIPMIKKAIRSVTMEEVRADLDHIFELETAVQVRAFISDRVRHLVPDLDERAFALESGNQSIH